jgi:hypothetical protein
MGPVKISFGPMTISPPMPGHRPVANVRVASTAWIASTAFAPPALQTASYRATRFRIAASGISGVFWLDSTAVALQ